MENKKRNNILLFLMFISTLGIGALFSFLFGLTENEVLANTVIAGIGGGMIAFVCKTAFIEHTYAYNNEEKWIRFFAIYESCLLISCLLPLLPEAAWFYPAIAVALAIYSNTWLGMVSSSFLLILSILLGQCDVHIFILYFICNLTAILVFSKIEDSFQVGIPIFVTESVLVVATVAMDTLFQSTKLSVELFLIPVINLFITGILLFILLKSFSVNVIHKYRGNYMVINDQEYELLVQLKQQEKQMYFHSIHCAYLCERIATKLELNVPLTKALGYYHKIGVLKGKNSSSVVAEICEEHQFPQEVKTHLVQYLDKHQKLTAKETTVLLFADAVITSISYIFEKNKDAVVNYEQVIDMIFKKKLENGSLKDSEITLAQLQSIRKSLMEETLYYDFLR